MARDVGSADQGGDGRQVRVGGCCGDGGRARSCRHEPVRHHAVAAGRAEAPEARQKETFPFRSSVLKRAEPLPGRALVASGACVGDKQDAPGGSDRAGGGATSEAPIASQRAQKFGPTIFSYHLGWTATEPAANCCGRLAAGGSPPLLQLLLLEGLLALPADGIVERIGVLRVHLSATQPTNHEQRCDSDGTCLLYTSPSPRDS